jgi:hypothetical protein
MGYTFNLAYFGLCAIVLACVGIIWLALVLFGASRLRGQEQRRSTIRQHGRPDDDTGLWRAPSPTLKSDAEARREPIDANPGVGGTVSHHGV